MKYHLVDEIFINVDIRRIILYRFCIFMFYFLRRRSCLCLDDNASPVKWFSISGDCGTRRWETAGVIAKYMQIQFVVEISWIIKRWPCRISVEELTWIAVHIQNRTTPWALNGMSIDRANFTTRTSNLYYTSYMYIYIYCTRICVRVYICMETDKWQLYVK